MDLIERKGDKLYDGEKELRFISINAPTLLDVTPWEQEDLIRSISQIGGRVTRTYTFSVNTVKEGSGSETGKFILGESNYNESALVRLDRLLEICNKCGIRIIIPFIDPYEYNGGIPAFNDFFGKKISEENSTIRNAAIFYEDTEIRNSFFRFVDTIVNRKNTVTGCLYKDDPAILAWESGNELPYYHEALDLYDNWNKTWIQTIRRSDKNHLILDGSSFGIRKEAADDPDIDIVSIHMYPHIVDKDFSSISRDFRDFYKGKKAGIIGEFGFIGPSEAEILYDEIIANGITGSLLWSLREHSELGGSIRHRENDKYYSYHWPGTSAGEGYDEIEMMRLTSCKAHEISGKEQNSIPVPDEPAILYASENEEDQLQWVGSTGAEYYELQSLCDDGISWKIISGKLIESWRDKDGKTVWNNEDLVLTKGSYRMRAVNRTGCSNWTEPYIIK